MLRLVIFKKPSMKRFLGSLSAIVAMGLCVPAIAEDAQGQWSGMIAGESVVNC